MERGNTKHGPRVDEEMEHEVRGTLQGRGAGGRVEEWREPEPAGEDQPPVSPLPGGSLPSGAPPGMTREEVEQRSELGRYLPMSALPGSRDELIAAADTLLAPDHVLRALASLPADGTRYETVAQVWAALGHHNETRRT
jgi:hypothetical protein